MWSASLLKTGLALQSDPPLSKCCVFPWLAAFWCMIILTGKLCIESASPLLQTLSIASCSFFWVVLRIILVLSSLQLLLKWLKTASRSLLSLLPDKWAKFPQVLLVCHTFENPNCFVAPLLNSLQFVLVFLWWGISRYSFVFQWPELKFLFNSGTVGKIHCISNTQRVYTVDVLLSACKISKLKEPVDSTI